jgi:membrane-associated phospholipid phosphatase
VALGAIPLALITSTKGRRFFLDWTPLFTFWLVYDRLRLLQPLLYDRVAVRGPYEIERWMFGWLGGGDAPAHAWRAWLTAQTATFYGPFLGWSAQLIYLSYLLILPIHLFVWWWRGRSRSADRHRFVRHLSAFTALHIMALLLYILAPVAPPWWVSLHGLVQPTAELVANTSMAAAMDGVIVQKMIKNAAQWFGAVPSLHAAYPMLFLLLSFKDRSRTTTVLLGLFSVAMCLTTIVLNQHYIIDLIAAGLLAVVAWFVAGKFSRILFGDVP